MRSGSVDPARRVYVHLRRHSAGRAGLQDPPGPGRMAEAGPNMTIGKPGRDAIMGYADMETSSPPTDQLVLDPVEPYSSTVSSRTLSWAPVRIPRERRMWTAALAAALLVSA